VVTDFDEAGTRLPGEIETALYRIAQEALSNAMRHSAATKILVRLTIRPGYVSLAVIDNGVGFDPDTALRGDAQGGVGLASVRERVDLVGGTVNVESAIGRGTRLYVVVPIAQSEPEGEAT
jgi:two-component system NarL family sensor kinase